MAGGYSLGVAQGTIIIAYDGAGVAKAEASVTGLQAKTKAAGVSMAAAGKTMAHSGAIIAAGLAVAVHTATDFQSKMKLLVTAAGEAPSALNAVSKGVQDIAVKTGTSLDNLASGAYEIEKAGYHGADALKVLQAAAEGARAEGAPLNVMGNALTSVMMSYHLHASDSVSVTNQLVAAAGRSKTTMENFANALSTVLPVASAAGVSFPQLSGAIATLTQHGTSAQESTQELANTIRGLQAPNAVAVKAMNQLGLSANDLSLELADPNKGLSGAIDDIETAILKKMGPAGLVLLDTMNKSKNASQDLQIMLGKMPTGLAKISQQFLDGTLSMSDYRKGIRDLGGSQYAMGQQFLSLVTTSQGFNQQIKTGGPAATTFSAQLKAVMGGATGMNTALMLGGQNMAYFNDTVKDVSAAAKKGGADISTWGQTSQTAAVKFGQLKAAGEVFAVNLGNAVLPAVTRIVKALTSMFTWLAKLPAPVQKVIGVGALMAASFLLLGSLFIKLVKFGQEFGKAMAVVGRGFKSVYQGVVKLLTKLGILTAAETEAATATEAQAVANEEAGVAAETAAGEQLSLNLALTEQEVAAAEAAAALQALVGVQEELGVALATAVPAEEAATAGMIGFDAAADANPIGAIALAVVALAAALYLLITHFQAVSKFLRGPLGTAISVAVATFMPMVGIAMLIIGHWKQLLSFFEMVGKAIASAFMTAYHAVAGVVADIVGIFQDIFNGVMGVVNAIGGWLDAHWKLIVKIILAPLGVMVALWAATWDLMKGTIFTVVGAIWAFLQTIFTAISSFITTTMQIIAGIFTAAWNAISAATMAVWNAIYNTVIKPTMIAIQNIITTITNAIKVTVSAVWNAIKVATSAIWHAIWAVLSPILNTIRSGVKAAFDAASTAVSIAWHAIGTVVSSVYHSVISPIISTLKSAVNGIKTTINGLKSAWGSAWNAIGGAAKSIYDHTVGPAISTLKKGLDDVKGLINDIVSTAKKVGSAANNLIHKGGKLNPLNWDDGGWVPGRVGQPVPGVVHGGEYVLSDNMLKGRQAIDPVVLAQLSAGQMAAMARRGDGMNGMQAKPALTSSAPYTNSSKTDARIFNFNTYNPSAEKASDSVARRVRTLAAIGAF